MNGNALTSSPPDANPGRVVPTASTPSPLEAGYRSAVAARVATVIANRRPLTADQLGELAAVLGCSASDLLPDHLGLIDSAPRYVELMRAAIRDHGVDEAPQMVDEGDAIRITRPAWCSDAWWTSFREAAEEMWAACVAEAVVSVRRDTAAVSG